MTIDCSVAVVAISEKLRRIDAVDKDYTREQVAVVAISEKLRRAEDHSV